MDPAAITERDLCVFFTVAVTFFVPWLVLQWLVDKLAEFIVKLVREWSNDKR